MEARIVAEELRATAALQGDAALALGQSIREAARSYGSIEEAHRRLEALVRGGESTSELRELVEYLGLVREMLAELSFALVECHPDKAQFLQVTDPLAAVARDGMQKGHLADWEARSIQMVGARAQALRTIVVKALAGEEIDPK